MRHIAKLGLIQLKLFAREPVALFFTLAFPLLLLFLFGMIWGNEPKPSFGGYGYIDAEVPGLIAIILGTVGLIGIPVTTATAREQKVLRRFKASPLPSSAFLAADIAVHFSISAVGLVMLVLAAKWAFQLRFDGSWLQVAVGFSLSALAFFAVGYTLASVAKTGRIAQVLGQVVFFPMMFLSGATIPLVVMPESVQRISKALPLTQVVLMLQDLWFGRGWNLTAVAVLTSMLIVGSVSSTLLFRWE